MTQQEIIEGSKIIADFCLEHEQRTPFGSSELVTYYKNPINNLQWRKVDELKFHSSWNWLMTVVEKIEYVIPLFPNDNSINVTIGPSKYCVIQDSNGDLIEIITSEPTRIQTVYKAVVQFINFYNKQQSHE